MFFLKIDANQTESHGNKAKGREGKFRCDGPGHAAGALVPSSLPHVTTVSASASEGLLQTGLLFLWKLIQAVHIWIIRLKAMYHFP